MLLINIYGFIFFSVLSIAASSGLGIASYHFLISQNQKATAEVFLFWAIIVVLCELIIMIVLLIRSKTKIATLNKVVDFARLYGSSVENQFNQFGEIGKSFNTIVKDVSELSDKRAARIKFLDNVLDMTCNLSDIPIIIVDITGLIIHISKAFEQSVLENHSSITFSSKKIGDVFASINYQSIIAKAETEHTTVDFDIENSKIVFYPVYNKDNQIDGFVGKYEKKTFAENASEVVQTIKKNYEDVKQRAESFSVENIKTKTQKKTLRSFFSLKNKETK